jgi:hypothetical protein
LLEKAFEIIREKLTQDKNKINNKKKLTEEIFIEKNLAYKIFYDYQEKKFELKTCELSQINEENWVTISSWFFDPETDGEKQAKSISEDFSETIRKPKKNNFKAKKKKKDENGNIDYTFLMNRLANIFPELKEEIKAETENYNDFRQVTFTRERISPKINHSLNNKTEKDKNKKIGNILSNLYNIGDLDVRALITVIILNSIENKNSQEEILKYLSDELKNAWNEAKKLKGKKIKPEKVKRKYNFMPDAP